MLETADMSSGRESGPLWTPIVVPLAIAASFVWAAMPVIGFPVRMRKETTGIGSGRLGGGGGETMGFADVSTRVHLPL